jgi:Cu(I)/Ag(I) efflux system membrane fusion protein
MEKIMKRGLFIIGSAIAILAIYFIYTSGSSTKVQEDQSAERKTASVSHSYEFNTSVSAMLQDYFSLKDILVHWDSVRIPVAVASLAVSMKDIVPDDSTHGGIALSKSVEHVERMSQETTIEKQRNAFNKLSLSLFTFLQESEYTVATIYKQECPMAFSDTVVAWWLSDTTEIINPYLGTNHPRYKNGMLHCGQVIDSISFAPLP